MQGFCVSLCVCVSVNNVKSKQALFLIGMCKRWQWQSAVPMQIYVILNYTDAISVLYNCEKFLILQLLRIRVW